MDIVLSTRNTSKMKQIRAVLEGLPLNVLSLDDVGIEDDAIENGTTIGENAMKKAFFAFQYTSKWSMADDTELCIDALQGQPGIRAARWAGEGLSAEKIMRYTLDRLKHVPLVRRTATFRTAAALISSSNHLDIFIGEVKGRFLHEPRCPCQPNMPYSAIFVPDGQSKVWAEMTVEEENAISHRGQAFRQLRDFIKKLL